ncbi:hypothetical protein Agub_g10010 [Astrephomene gubernaculifera]|uniref:Agmatine deiminase n=1 Tax=Astrephomene gubernaculifera TaxID=47775 RepID=A0AAD3DU54_9CHLO|nr:hypothetical protein Agub_g10010 [Astrephomene gubernaculifera]
MFQPTARIPTAAAAGLRIAPSAVPPHASSATQAPCAPTSSPPSFPSMHRLTRNHSSFSHISYCHSVTVSRSHRHCHHHIQTTPSAAAPSAARSFSSTATAGPSSPPPDSQPASTLPAGPAPRSLGFRMPGEFEPHAGTWMAFPYDPHLWREAAVPAQQQMAALAAAVAQFEPVWMVADPRVAHVARRLLRDVPGVEVLPLPTNDVWTRDWGPTCVVRDDLESGSREVAAVLWDYNCYGAPIKKEWGKPVLLPDWSADKAAGGQLAARAGLRTFRCELHLEGGSIHCDGLGTLLATEECLLHPSRNPHLSRADIEAQLCEFLGATRVVWLRKGMAGDEKGTNGHVDNVATFSEPGTVLLAWCDDPRDAQQHRVSQLNLEALQAAGVDATGRPLRVVKVPCPEPPIVVTEAEAGGLAARAAAAGYGGVAVAGVRLPGSYINHYVVNGGVVVPQFGGEQSDSDAAALSVLSAAYPGRRVVGVLTRELLLGGGNVHCLTQQLPTGWRGRHVLGEKS